MNLGKIDDNGYLRVITADDTQIEELRADGWKPIDDIDGDKLCCEDGYVVKMIAYDAGDKIAYRYDVEVDTIAIMSSIDDLKKQLSDSDYKVIKCYEASLAGEELPYNMQELHQERQSLRERINELEGALESLSQAESSQN